MANVGHSSAVVLRAMLEAGGNTNTRDEFGRPMILMDWYFRYYKHQARSRVELLLDHGADANSAISTDRANSAEDPLLLHRTGMGLDDNLAYSDPLLYSNVASIQLVQALMEWRLGKFWPVIGRIFRQRTNRRRLSSPRCGTGVKNTGSSSKVTNV